MDSNDSEQGIAITTVIVLPRNQHYCRYVINEGSVHTKKYDELEQFLIHLIPEKSQVITELLRTFRNFMLIVPTREVEEFHFDFSGQRDKMEQEVKQAIRTKLPPDYMQRKKSTQERVEDVLDDTMHRTDKWNLRDEG